MIQTPGVILGGVVAVQKADHLARQGRIAVGRVVAIAYSASGKP